MNTNKIINREVIFEKNYLNTKCFAFQMKYSYCPTVLGRVGLDHECRANAGNGKKKTVKNKKKLQDLKAHFHTYTTKQILTI